MSETTGIDWRELNSRGSEPFLTDDQLDFIDGMRAGTHSIGNRTGVPESDIFAMEMVIENIPIAHPIQTWALTLMGNQFGDMIRALSRHASWVTEGREWISVEDQLPEHDKPIWGRQVAAYGCAIKEWHTDYVLMNDFKTMFTHWCPRYVDTPPPFTEPTRTER